MFWHECGLLWGMYGMLRRSIVQISSSLANIKYSIRAALRMRDYMYSNYRFCFARQVTGDDLHTAMLNHKIFVRPLSWFETSWDTSGNPEAFPALRIPRVRKLLEFSLGGEVLDVNGPTKECPDRGLYFQIPQLSTLLYTSLHGVLISTQLMNLPLLLDANGSLRVNARHCMSCWPRDSMISRNKQSPQDAERATASMLAAKSGFVEGLRMVMSCGGRPCFLIFLSVSSILPVWGKVEVRNSKGAAWKCCGTPCGVFKLYRSLQQASPTAQILARNMFPLATLCNIIRFCDVFFFAAQ